MGATASLQQGRAPGLTRRRWGRAGTWFRRVFAGNDNYNQKQSVAEPSDINNNSRHHNRCVTVAGGHDSSLTRRLTTATSLG
jgi:hypothetical protein